MPPGHVSSRKTLSHQLFVGKLLPIIAASLWLHCRIWASRSAGKFAHSSGNAVSPSLSISMRSWAMAKSESTRAVGLVPALARTTNCSVGLRWHSQALHALHSARMSRCPRNSSDQYTMTSVTPHLWQGGIDSNNCVSSMVLALYGRSASLILHILILGQRKQILRTNSADKCKCPRLSKN